MHFSADHIHSKARILSEVSDLYEPSRTDTMRLANIPCHRVLPSEFTVGDFAYYYSSQLDAFSIYECVHADPREVKLSEIDSDQLRLCTRDLVEERGARLAARYTLWRAADPKQRAKVEAEGFKSRYSTWSFCKQPERRYLVNTLYHRSVFKILINLLSFGALFPKKF